jgi:hypothetical protein
MLEIFTPESFPGEFEAERSRSKLSCLSVHRRRGHREHGDLMVSAVPGVVPRVDLSYGEIAIEKFVPVIHNGERMPSFDYFVLTLEQAKRLAARLTEIVQYIERRGAQK